MMSFKFLACATVFAAVALSPRLINSAEAPPSANETTGPIGTQTPPCKWGTSVKDEVNNEWLWFGGTGGISKTGALLTYIFKDNAWKRAEFKERPELAEVHAAVADARLLYAAVANRYYQSENQKAVAVKLDETARGLAARVDKPAFGAEAKGFFAGLATKLSSAPSAKEIGAAREGWMALVKSEFALLAEPAPRNYSGLVFDVETKKIVLFGGEGEFGAYNDTWIYDCATRTWSLAHPAVAPSPRCGMRLAAQKGKVYLAGGFEPAGSMSYCGGLWNRLPVDVWQFEIASATWTLLKAGEGKAANTTAQPSVELTLNDDGKSLAWKADQLSYGKKIGEVSGKLELPATDAGTAKAGVAPGTIKVRENGFDPAWYENVPPADAAAFQEFLKKIPANKWVNVKPPVQHVNRDWGTTILDVEHDQLLHWAGGHSSHCGTDVAHYSLATNRWHTLYTPEIPFEYAYSNDGSPVPTLSAKPWGPHSYLSYAMDAATGKMIWAGSHGCSRVTNPCGLWTYDPETYAWSAPQWKIDGGWFDIERHKTCMVPTPQGIAVWGDKRGGSGGETGLWLAKMSERVFTPLAGTDKKDSTTFPFATFGDRQGITYDSKRDRVLLFHFGVPEKAKVWSCDLKTKTATTLTPKNAASFPQDLNMGREATYIPDVDLVLIPTPGKTQRTVFYDCAGDQWLEMSDPCTTTSKNVAPVYNVSTGVEWDAKRKLLWLVETDGSVFTLRFERETAELKPLQ